MNNFFYVSLIYHFEAQNLKLEIDISHPFTTYTFKNKRNLICKIRVMIEAKNHNIYHAEQLHHNHAKFQLF